MFAWCGAFTLNADGTAILWVKPDPRFHLRIENPAPTGLENE